MGTPSPYEYTRPTAVESKPKSYSSTAAPDDSSGFERYATIEDASEEHTKSAKMSVVSVQKGP